MGRIVLNEPVAAGEPAGAAAGEDLQRRMLAALGAATGADGRVDYRRLAASAEFADAVEAARRVGRVDPDALGDRAACLAFWINVYNALVLHGIVHLGVRRSVTEVWNFFGRVSYRVGRFALSADEIEHGILRGNPRRVFPPLRPFSRTDPRLGLALVPGDPRIHFAITCGARSCPPVGVYRADAIDAQLDLATRGFVNREVGLEGGRVVCSKIFKWYRGDFHDAGGLGPFLLRYLDDGPARAAIARGASPCGAFRRYSWALQHEPVE